MKGHIILKPEKKYIGIGEDHAGAYVFSFSNSTHLNALVQLLNNQKNITVWFEGPNLSAKSKSFKNFVKELKTYIQKQKLNIIINEKGWEIGYAFPKDIEYASILLGPDVSWVLSILAKELTGNQPLITAIAKSHAFRGTQAKAADEKDIIEALTDYYKPTDILELMMSENSATVNNVKAIWGGEYAAMRAKYFEGTPGALLSSKVYKRVNSFNKLRDKNLANKMKSYGGIFLAGNDHIRLVSKML